VEVACIRVIYLNAAILYSIWWFEKKLMVLSLLMGFRNMLFSVLDGFRIRSRSKKFICPMSSCVGLHFTSLNIRFILAVVRSGCLSF